MSFKFTPSNDRVLCLHAPQGIAPGNSWTGGISSKDYKMENDDKGNENKQYLKNLIALWIKWTEMVKIKHKDLVGAAPVMPCQNSS